MKKEIVTKNLKDSMNRYAQKLDERLRNKDYDGVITISKTYLESAIDYFSDFLLEDVDNPIKKKQLPDKFHYLKKFVRLYPEKETNDKMKAILDSLSKIVGNLHFVANELGDRHSSLLLPKPYEAKFIADLSKIFVEFLYERINFLYHTYPDSTKNYIYKKLIRILNKGSNRNLSRGDLLKLEGIKNLFSTFENDPYILNILKNKFIRDYEIESFRENDIFFSAMRLFFDSLTKKDVRNVFQKCKDNDQTFPLWGHLISFLFAVKKLKPSDFWDKEMENFIGKVSFKETIGDEIKKFKYMFDID